MNKTTKEYAEERARQTYPEGAYDFESYRREYVKTYLDAIEQTQVEKLQLGLLAEMNDQIEEKDKEIERQHNQILGLTLECQDYNERLKEMAEALEAAVNRLHFMGCYIDSIDDVLSKLQP